MVYSNKMSSADADLNKAIVCKIEISVEVNGQLVEQIQPEDICPWHEPPKPKKTWRRRLGSRTTL